MRVCGVCSIRRGAAYVVKADVLFQFLTSQKLVDG